MSGGTGRRVAAAVFGVSRVRGMAPRLPGVQMWRQLSLGRRILASVLGLRPSGVARGGRGGGGGVAAGTGAVPGVRRRPKTRRDRTSVVRVQGIVPVRGGAVGVARVRWATLVLVGGVVMAGLAVAGLQDTTGPALGGPVVSVAPTGPDGTYDVGAPATQDTYDESASPTEDATDEGMDPPAPYWLEAVALPLSPGSTSVSGVAFDENGARMTTTDPDLQADGSGTATTIVIASGVAVATSARLDDDAAVKQALWDCELPLLDAPEVPGLRVDAVVGRTYCFSTIEGATAVFSVGPARPDSVALIVAVDGGENSEW